MSFYKTKRWRDKRVIILKRDSYLCKECLRYGKTTPATTVHHVNPLEHNRQLALVSKNLISLCETCHNKMHDRDTHELTELGISWVERIGKI
ncbi:MULTISPECIES: HNH endonuclease [unclassified Sedimentibacter]|uniref:HNH endonuclease n=1 Tax=unclassified Sedimentibacter TaxID=2649220 RepID=UPI0027E05787|nr:HNH endonuclease [Sedimentibacter sp. MB35-C1]WMJ78471.1 HNH endonuclease [Sedimentibacter sp. MB35-C1]